MGVYISGANIPLKGGFLDISIDDEGVVWERDFFGWNEIGKAIEIPTPHGRLIDADKLIDLWTPHRNSVFPASYFTDTAESGETIIEAEE